MSDRTGMRHYRLPDGNVQIAFSGGRTSAYMLYHILEANGDLPDRARVLFQNTGREMPQTLDFVHECGERWGVHITWLEYLPDAPHFETVSHNSASRNGEPFEKLIRKKKYLPNQQARFCTIELKIRTAKRYLMSLGWTEWANAIGFRADEPRRIRPEDDKGKDRWFTWQPLNHAGVTKRDVAAFWKRQPFDLCLPNVNGNAALGNCDGCFLKSEATLAMLARDYPERHQWWEDMERRATDLWFEMPLTQRLKLQARKVGRSEWLSIPKSARRRALTDPGYYATFRKDQPRAKLRDFIDRQGDWIFDTEGALCQADHGECT